MKKFLTLLLLAVVLSLPVTAFAGDIEDPGFAAPPPPVATLTGDIEDAGFTFVASIISLIL